MCPIMYVFGCPWTPRLQKSVGRRYTAKSSRSKDAAHCQTVRSSLRRLDERAP